MADKKAIAARNDKFRVSVIESPIRQAENGRFILTSGIANQDPLVVAHILHRCSYIASGQKLL